MQHFQPPIKSAYGETILSPEEILHSMENTAVTKTMRSLVSMASLAILGGAYVALGGMFCTAVLAGVELGAGPTRLLGGLAFSLGLMLVVVAGAELFTGNILMLLGLARGRITPRAMLLNWGVVFAGNAVGALGVVACVAATGLLDGPQGAVAAKIAQTKMALDPVAVFARALLCNLLVCLAIWLAASARTTTGKIVGLAWPVTAFVAVGLEHSIANLYLLPAGLLAGAAGSGADVAVNIACAAAGNMAGAALLVLGYRAAYASPTPTSV